jgi:hypothetical protein
MLPGVGNRSPLTTSSARMDGAIGPKAHDPFPPTLPAAYPQMNLPPETAYAAWRQA